MYKNIVSKEGDLLSRVWLEIFQELLEPKVEGIFNLTISIQVSTEWPLEDERVRSVLDQALVEKGCYSSRTTANTIFPPLWNPKISREKLYERYANILPKLKRASPANYHGLYFERLVQYGPEHEDGHPPINQLEHIISTYQRGNHRESALQASIFDPEKDHTNQRQRGFPCLQHVFFTPREKKYLAVTGVYAKQYIFDRAYGNYLGLYHLGTFMAHEMGLTLTHVNCITNQAELGDSKKINKSKGQLLLEQIRQSLIQPRIV